MGFRCGFVGLPNVGKSTLFNALTKAHAEVANYPFTTIAYNKGMVAVPDTRLPELGTLFKPERLTPTTIEYYDIAGLVKGAHTGEGLGNQFLSHINEVDLICHVVRLYTDDSVVHVEGTVDPLRDIDIIETELLLHDIEKVDKRIKKTEPLLRAGDKQAHESMQLYTTLLDKLNQNIPVRDMQLSEEELLAVRDLFLLTGKPILYVGNMHEREVPEGGPYAQEFVQYANRKGARAVILSARIEDELRDLPRDERKEYLVSYGLETSGLDALITASYEVLGLVTFYTVVGPEVRAWTVPRGTKAPQAAGVIHSDFEKGFIAAEIVAFQDLTRCGSWARAREAGVLRQEGRHYMVCDGDVCLFKFAV